MGMVTQKKSGHRLLGEILVFLLVGLAILLGGTVGVQAADPKYLARITTNVNVQTYLEAEQADYEALQTRYDKGEDVFLIGTASELAAVAKLVNVDGKSFAGKTIILENDIDLKGAGFATSHYNNYNGTYSLEYNGNVINAWKAIGAYGKPFKGNFNGAGFKIKNMTAIANLSDNNSYAGLFGYVDGSVIENVIIGDETDNFEASHTLAISSEKYAFAGSVVASAANAKITNCYNTGTVGSVTKKESSAGGVLGASRNTNEISNCYNSGSVSVFSLSSSAYASGIVGEGTTKTSISNCYNTGDLAVASAAPATENTFFAHAGGILARSRGVNNEISNCYNTGSLTSAANTPAYAGGILGEGTIGKIQISHCYNTGKMSSKGTKSCSAAGIVGAWNDGELSACYNVGSVEAEGTNNQNYVGGIIATMNPSGTFDSCYYECQEIKGSHINGEGKELAGLNSSLVSSNYKTFVLAPGTNPVNVFADIDGQDPAARVWLYAEGKGPDLKYLNKFFELSFSKKGNELTAMATAKESTSLGAPVNPVYEWYVDGKRAGTGSTYSMKAGDESVGIFVMLTTAENYVGSISSTLGKRHSITVPTLAKGVISASGEEATKGAAITLTVTPDKGYRLKAGSLKYNDDVINNQLGENRYQFTMPDENAVIGAEFELVDYKIDLDTPANGLIEVEPPRTTAVLGETIVVKVTAREGYELAPGSVKLNDGTPLEAKGGDLYEFTMPAKDVRVTASFIPIIYQVGVDPAIFDGNIQVTPEVATVGMTITVTVTPDNGYRLVKDSLTYGEAPIAGSGNTYTFEMPAKNVVVTGKFERIYKVAIDDKLVNGDISVNALEAAENEPVTVTVMPAKDYELAAGSLQCGGADITQTGSNEFEFLMPAKDVEVTAAFQLIPPNHFKVEVEPGIQGGAIFSPKTSAPFRDTVIVTVNPKPGYQLADESLKLVGGEAPIQFVNGQYQFAMPNGNVVITGAFTKINYDITVAEGLAGTITPSQTTAQSEDLITLEVQPNEGYELVDGTLKYNDNVISPKADGTYQFTMPAAKVTLTAQFNPIDYSIIVEDAANGEIIPDKTTAHVSDTIKLTVKPAEGYRLAANSLKLNNIPVDVINGECQFEMPAADVRITAAFEPIPSETFPIRIEQNTPGGTISAAKSDAEAGETVTTTVTPDEGYRLVEGSLKQNGKVIELVDGRYQFTMPAEEVLITAAFEPIPKGAAPTGSQPRTGDPLTDGLALLVLALMGAGVGVVWSGRRREGSR